MKNTVDNLSKSKVILMCGPAGAGKSTLAKKFESTGMTILSYDEESFKRGFNEHPLPQEVLEDITVIPFDTRGRRWPILFTLTDESNDAIANAKNELMKVLPNAIRLSALAARDYVNERYYPFVTWYTQIKDGNLIVRA